MLLGLPTLSVAQPSKELRVAVYKLEPYTIIDEKGVVSGTAIEIVKTIAKNLQLSVKIIDVPFARALASVKTGEFDAILLVAKNKEREELLRYTKEPIVKDKNAFLVPKNSRIKAATPLAQFNGLSVGHVIGSVVPEYLSEAKIKWVMVGMEDYFKVNLNRLENFRVDALFIPTMSHGQWKVKNEFPMAQVRFLPIESSDIKLYLAFSKIYDQKTFEKIDKELVRQLAQTK